MDAVDQELPPKWPRKRRRRWPLFLLAVSPLVLLTTLQRKLIYHPNRESPDIPRAETSLKATIVPVHTKTTDELTLQGWLVPAGSVDRGASPAELVSSGPLVIWFNGNAGHRAYRLAPAALCHRLGIHFLDFDYRGYAENPGSPSEDGLATDARAVWNYATKELGVPRERIIVCGESLGGGVAIRLVSDLCREGTPPAGLFTQATFSSLTDAGAYHYPILPVRWILRDRFDSLSRIGNVTCPLLMIHGQRDRIVPFMQGEELFSKAPSASATGLDKQFVSLPEADHNDIFDYSPTAASEWMTTMRGFVDQVMKSP
jgi:fermentation-respiration switch protein FrsA (DUF1100 family)